MLSKKEREEYYERIRYSLDHRAKYVHILLDKLQKDHEEAITIIKTIKGDINNGKMCT